MHTGGTLSYTIFRTISEQGSSTEQTQGVSANSNLEANSYFWQPWFARINTGVGVNADASRSNGAAYSRKAQGLGVNGHVTVQLIPISRFPFALTFNRSKVSQKNGSTSNSTYRYNSSILLTQGFKSRVGTTKGSASLGHNWSVDNFSNILKQDSAAFSLSHMPNSGHYILAIGNFGRTFQPFFNFRNSNGNLSVSYNMRAIQNLSVSNSLDLSKSNYLENNKSTRSATQQLKSQTSWRSASKSLSVVANARVYNSNDVRENFITSTDGINLNLGADYFITTAIRARGSINISDTREGAQNISTVAAITSTKRFTDYTNLSGFLYKRYIQAGLSNQSAATSGNVQKSSNSQNLSMSAGHSLTKNALFYGNKLVSNVNQTVSSSISSSRSNTPAVQLSSSASLNWVIPKQNAFVKLNAVDSRSLNSNNSGARQGFGLLASRIGDAGRFQTLFSSLSVILTRQAATSSTPSSRNLSTSAILTYGHTRPFHLRNLDFHSSLKVNSSAGSNEVSSKNADLIFWDNTLKYKAGALEVNLNANITQVINGARSEAITLSAFRTF
jgi:hypothetical protein